MEFEFIEQIRTRFPRYPGDDCAILEPLAGKILLTTDELVEDVHFSREYFDLVDVGYKAMSAACSDIAAMGGKLRGVLISLSLPQDFSMNNLNSLYDGIDTFCHPLRADIFGGNITQSDCGLHIVTSVIGIVENPILRNGAKAGDKIFHTGTLGGALAGYYILSGKAEPQISDIERDMLAFRHRRPRSRMEAGIVIAETDVSAMIDISDGFCADLMHIASESKVGVKVELDKIPLFPGVEEVAGELKMNPFILAAKSGEEFELLFTASEDEAEIIASKLNSGLDVPITQVGEVIESGFIAMLDGEELSADVLSGWEHL